ncbi:hypothetical protein M5689_006219 [Euphorbia peplus]|nr:hypothetical protein M5689_006219 [Euphorbia peplus]
MSSFPLFLHPPVSFHTPKFRAPISLSYFQVSYMLFFLCSVRSSAGSEKSSVGSGKSSAGFAIESRYLARYSL